MNTEKLAGGRLKIKTEQQAVRSLQRGDMRECGAEKQAGLTMSCWDPCVLTGRQGETCEEMFEEDTE